MTVVRPAVRVCEPDGREWEIYAYKVQLRDRGDPAELGGGPPEWGPSAAAVEWALLDAIFYVLWLVPRTLWRLVEHAAAFARTIRSDAWTVDAVTQQPRHTVYSWTTTSEHKGQVLAQVEGHLARGDIPQRLRNAVYLGERRSAR
jgi:hypothetical protein